MISANNLWNKIFEEDLEYIINNCRSDLKKISKGNAFVDNEGKAYSVQEITNYLENLLK